MARATTLRSKKYISARIYSDGSIGRREICCLRSAASGLVCLVVGGDWRRFINELETETGRVEGVAKWMDLFFCCVVCFCFYFNFCSLLVARRCVSFWIVFGGVIGDCCATLIGVGDACTEHTQKGAR